MFVDDPRGNLYQTHGFARDENGNVYRFKKSTTSYYYTYKTPLKNRDCDEALINLTDLGPMEVEARYLGGNKTETDGVLADKCHELHPITHIHNTYSKYLLNVAFANMSSGTPPRPPRIDPDTFARYCDELDQIEQPEFESIVERLLDAAKQEVLDNKPLMDSLLEDYFRRKVRNRTNN